MKEFLLSEKESGKVFLGNIVSRFGRVDLTWSSTPYLSVSTLDYDIRRQGVCFNPFSTLRHQAQGLRETQQRSGQ